MTATNKLRAIHPGEILREEYLIPLALTSHALAMNLHVPATRINDVVREKRGITIDTAIRLARFFGTTAQFWLNLQNSYDLKLADAKGIEKKIENEVQPLIVAA